VSSSTCGGSATKANDWAKYDVAVGRPSVLTVSVTSETAPDGATFAAAVGEAVPPTAYPFPPRPAELKALPDLQFSGHAVVRPDPADPNRQRQVTTEWSGSGQLIARSNTPGRLRVLVNDVEVLDFSCWDYEVGGLHAEPLEVWEDRFGLRLERGQQVTVTVIPERTSGDWMVELPAR
jgi:hypothetical protein